MPSYNFREQIKPNDNLCAQYPNIAETLFGSDTSNMILAPIIILACFAGARILIGLIALAKHVRFTGKVSYTNTFLVFYVIYCL